MKYNLCVASLSLMAQCLCLVTVDAAGPIIPFGNLNFSRLLRVQRDQTIAKILDVVDECNQTQPVPLKEGLKMFGAEDPKFLEAKGELPSTKDGKCLIDCTMRKMNMITDNGFQSNVYVKVVKQILFNYTSYDLAAESLSIKKMYADAVRSNNIEYRIVHRYETVSQICQMGVQDPKKDKISISTILPSGSGGRWGFGVVILIYLIVYNENGGPTTFVATILASISALFSAICKSSLQNIQIAYLRATQKFDFFCLFIALWLDILTLLTACGALARTLSTCLDAMTGGMARIYLLGRNSDENEPWPDVLGVSVVFLLTVMFMLGLENTKVFSILMSVGVLGITLIVISLSYIRGNNYEWHNEKLIPNGLFGLLSSAALSIFTFPCELPNGGTYKKLIGFGIVLAVALCCFITTGCLSSITQYISNKPFIAVPILSVLETQDFHKVEPAVACLLVLACSGAFLELFPEMYSLIVKLTSSEFKILPRQIGYESGDSGSPVLAIFTGGSLCAMLAFACPLQNLIYILAASNLCSGICRAFYLLYSPYRPKYMANTSNEASLAYSRLDAPRPSSSRRSLWSFNKPKSISIHVTKSRRKKSKRDIELEREWLLLGEPQSPRVAVLEDCEAESSILTEPAISDVDCIDREMLTETDSSTDIDAIVDEYRQKVKVSTAGPMEKIIRIPTVSSWRSVLLLIFILTLAIELAVYGLLSHSMIFFMGGSITVALIGIVMMFIPKYAHSQSSPSSITCSVTILLEILLLISTLQNSWPAILFWIIAGITLYIRCDTWCCLCLEQQRSQLLIPSVTSNMATIRMPCPPRGSLIPSRISGHR